VDVFAAAVRPWRTDWSSGKETSVGRELFKWTAKAAGGTNTCGVSSVPWKECVVE